MNVSFNAGSARRLTWSKADVCHALGIAEGTFDKHRRRLEAEHGFPRKLPGFGLWSIAAVTDWVRRNAGTYDPVPAVAAPSPSLPPLGLTDEAEALEARYAEAG